MIGSIAAILLPCLVSGYALSKMKVVLRYLPETIGGNTYFRILLIGFLWVSFWLGLAVLDGWIFLNEGHFGTFWQKWLAVAGGGSSLDIYWKILPIGFLATALAVAMHWLEGLAFSIAFRCSVSYANNFYLRVLENSSRDMEAFLGEAMGKSRLIMFTLKNGKTYIGWVISMKLLKDIPEWLHILPVMSDYRSQESMEPITTYYLDPDASYSEERLSCLKMALPVKAVFSLRLFDLDLHKEIQARKGRRASTAGD